ncbi:cytochrome P450 [Mycena belliarum]|uniref:Cytochrome P450 n=1 Tax=Mycena belliarum TaxID=1033014 RepID=A0AAD6XLK5_9AGAR|nr:cytochrome P450 [Mycena belliae]
MSFQLTFYSLVLVSLLLFLHRKTLKSKGIRPRGPPGLPFIGNIHQIRKHPWITFMEWSKIYGPIFHLNIAGQDAIVLGSHKVAADLLDRRSAIYSDRPRNIVTRILTGDLVFAFTQITPIWRRMRRASHDALGPKVSKTYHVLQEREVVWLADQMIKAPTLFRSHIQRTSASLVMSIIYGTPIADSEDPIILEIQHFVDRALGAAAPGAFIVEYFTWMQYLPRWMSGWRRYAEYWYEKDSALLTGLFSGVQARVDAGDNGPSVAAKLIKVQDQDSLSVLDSAWLSATLYAAGAETSAGQMEWFMVSMILNPGVQKAAHTEMDNIIGRGRMPTLNDYDQLPYIRAIVKEVLRWRPVLPLGACLPHRLSQDDWYDGYFLPKDTTVIPNIWGLNHDTTVYGSDADTFRPERHLDEAQKLKPAPKDTKEESHCSFGFGKRVCVGRHVANRTLFIEVATILWSFNICAAQDESGNFVMPSSEPATEGTSLILRPRVFGCELIPRFSEVPTIIAHTMDVQNSDATM